MKRDPTLPISIIEIGRRVEVTSKVEEAHMFDYGLRGNYTDLFESLRLRILNIYGLVHMGC